MKESPNLIPFSTRQPPVILGGFKPPLPLTGAHREMAFVGAFAWPYYYYRIAITQCTVDLAPASDAFADAAYEPVVGRGRVARVEYQPLEPFYYQTTNLCSDQAPVPEQVMHRAWWFCDAAHSPLAGAYYNPLKPAYTGTKGTY